MIDHPLRIAVALGVVYLVWGACFVVTKFALEGFSPMMLAGLRNLLAGGCLAALATRETADPAGPPRVKRTLQVALLAVVGGTGLATVALGTVPAGLASLIFALSPLWLVGLAAVAGTPPRPREFVGLALGGAALAFALSFDGPVAHPAGVAALLAAGACWAGASELTRRESRPFTRREVASQLTIGGSALVAAALVIEGLPRAVPTSRAFAALLFLTLGGSVLAYQSYLYLLRVCRPALAASHAYVNPLVALALGAVFLGEPCGPGALTAMACGLLAVAVTGGAGPSGEPAAELEPA